MKMREYVDSLQGAGAWDRMHDLIDQKRLGGWSMPPVDVDGQEVHIFPGTNRDITLEQVQNEIRKSFVRIGGPLRPAGSADLYGVPRAEE